MSAGDYAINTPPANGIAALALVVEMMKALKSKGAIDAAEADAIVGNAIGELRQIQTSPFRDAVSIIEQDIAPIFARR